MKLHVAVLEAVQRESFSIFDVAVGLAVSVPSSGFRVFWFIFRGRHFDVVDK